MKRLFYILSILSFIVAVIIIGFHMNFLLLVGVCFALGAAAFFWGGERFALYLFVFLLPFINASPALMGSAWPYNYTAPALFLLCGILLPQSFSLSKVFGPTFFQKGRPPEAESRDFYFYYLFLLLLFVSTFFVFLRWSNITLGNITAVGADTPVSAPLPRFSTNDSLIWIEQRLSSAIIFPVISLFLYFISPYIFFYIRRVKPGEKTIFKWLSFGFYISTALAGLQKIVGQSHLSDRLGKGLKQFNGGFSDFNALGVFAGMMFLWSTYEIKKKNVLGYVTFAVSLAGGILSGSRTMFFFAAAGIVNLLLGAVKNREKKQKWVAGILIVVFLVLVIFAGGTLKKRLMGADWDAKETLFDKLDAMVNGRLKMAMFSLDIIRDYFLTGVGTGNYTFYLSYKNYLPYKDSGKVYLYDLPMNQYLWIFVENGFPAFLVFSFFLVLLYRRSNKKLLTGTILVVLLFNNFFWFPEAFLLFWILAAFTYPPGMQDKMTSSNKKQLLTTVICLAVLILFNLISFNRLHPKTWAQETGITYDYGVWPGEKDAKGMYFNWTKERAGVLLALDKNGESPLIKIICGAPFNYLKSKEQKVKIYWKGKLEREMVFTGNDTVEFKIKSVPMEEGVLEIRVRPVFNPKKLGIGNDNRDLGVCYIM
ncbi:MAG TPA: O-antigen ligase family protein [Candidatus Kapabacteria bacterium]|nr:O-antigen ligase family protein [Candidatus Kapabacteria bacterium]